MNYVTLIILLLIGIIIVAAIFKDSFQEKVFGGSESETTIAGVFSVRGVSFVTLIVGLTGVATYFELQRSSEIGINQVIEHLKFTNNDQFSFHFYKEDSIDLKLNGTSIGRFGQPIDVNITKSLTNKNSYEIKYDKARLGSLKLNVLQNSLIYSHGNIYWEDSAYNIENSSFWFRIEKIESIQINPNLKIAKYHLRFGEGQSKQAVKWSANTIEFGKSDDGKLPNSMKIIHETGWNNSYVIAMGVGLFGENYGKNYIEEINAILVKIRIQ
ncbi:MAG: hypothetical protein COA58_00225 [Bacteroidetes bacterium]|nr:MAG: hypothetical protein COA58_00225 [Bacteroidota bacterium]